jgi:translocator protein
MKTIWIYAFFILMTVAGGLVIGISNPPGEWYQALQKPFFNPPGYVFAPVWTVLYVLIGIVGARAYLQRGPGDTLNLWFVQLGFNFLWSPAFFRLQSPAIALGVIVLLLISILALMMASRTRDRLSVWLLTPYALWVAFATLLNATIVFLN